MEEWKAGLVTGNLLDVPGIGPATVKKLSEGEEAITNTYQLFGKYLMLKGPDSEGHKVDSLEHSEKFWQYLKTRGITSHRSAIVRAIAEKSSSFFPEIYDANLYADDEEDEDDDS